MGRKLHYKPGSFYRTDDRTGFPQRAERTRMEWNGLIVDEARWEPRQPQDLVKGVPDYQSVPDARPLGQNVYVGPISVQTTADAVIGQMIIPVQSTFGFYPDAKVGCMLDLDGGTVFFTTIVPPLPVGPTLEWDAGVPALYGTDQGQYIQVNSSLAPGTLSLAKGLPYPMSSGNLITLYKASPSPAPGLP